MNIYLAQAMANSLMNKHGLIDAGWRFDFDTAKRRFGATRYNHKLITLSRELTELNNADVVRDTILHEIAHALVDKQHGHDRVWRFKAIEIGCNGARTYGSEVVKPKATVIGTCPNCSKTIYRYKRMSIACSACCKKFNNGRYSDNYKFDWSK